MITLDDWADWMQSIGQSEHTIRIRVAPVNLLCRYREIDDPTTITRIDVIKFLGRAWKPWTRITYWSGIDAWGKFVRDFGGMPDFEPTKGIDRPRTPEGVARPISDAAVLKLLNSRLTWRTRTYILLGLFQGLRVHEIAKIKAEDVDVAAGWLTILGKGGIEKTIPLHPEVQEIAQRTLPNSGWWFPRRDGTGHVHPASVSTAVSNAMHRVGINGTAHQLRDTCATRIQRQSHDLRLTQTLLRHKRVTSTQKYTAVDDEALREAVAGLSWAA